MCKGRTFGWMGALPVQCSCVHRHRRPRHSNRDNPGDAGGCGRTGTWVQVMVRPMDCGSHLRLCRFSNLRSLPWTRCEATRRMPLHAASFRRDASPASLDSDHSSIPSTSWFHPSICPFWFHHGTTVRARPRMLLYVPTRIPRWIAHVHRDASCLLRFPLPKLWGLVGWTPGRRDGVEKGLPGWIDLNDLGGIGPMGALQLDAKRGGTWVPRDGGSGGSTRREGGKPRVT